MLLFIFFDGTRGGKIFNVSIHLMLLFIVDIEEVKVDIGTVSIHLMLLFIAERGEDKPIKQQFQYISCCYLSNGFKAFLFFAFPIHPLF